MVTQMVTHNGPSDALGHSQVVMCLWCSMYRSRAGLLLCYNIIVFDLTRSRKTFFLSMLRARTCMQNPRNFLEFARKLGRLPYNAIHQLVLHGNYGIYRSGLHACVGSAAIHI